jgi:subtilisin family serine protease/subtilisin-like proprotein convertase family protein
MKSFFCTLAIKSIHQIILINYSRKWRVFMGITSKYFTFFSASVFAVSFLSSCGKSNNSNDFKEQSLLNQESNRNKFCTDLSDKVKNPLGRYQWHLKNTGQKAFATEPGIAGEDINADSAFKNDCLSGNGIHVGIVDSGLQVIHPSLKPNIDNNTKTKSINFRNNRLLPNDPSPISEDDTDHGTMVGGIIAMRSNLGFGGSGVAPRAKLTGYNIIQAEAGVQIFQNFIDSLGGSDASKGNDVFNMSYGNNNLRQISSNDPIILASMTACRYGVKYLRNGKGALYVKAAGNGFKVLNNGNYYESEMACRLANRLGVSCQNSSMNIENTLAEVITVGALNAKGKKASYSTTGSSLWISAPGGESGIDQDWVNSYMLGGVTYGLNPNSGEPAIVTTDVTGSRYGMSKVNKNLLEIKNSFNAGMALDDDGKYLNSEFDYTNTMNGTSSATPIITGGIALILEANPNLTWRDVKYILAETATKVDPAFQGVNVELANGEKYQAEDGWVINAAGFHFSNWYGFGRINIGEAIKLAKNYNVNLGKYIEMPWYPADQYNYNISIDVPQGAAGIVYKLKSIPRSSNVKIETVRAEVSVNSFSFNIGDVALELTSPSGTKSIIWHTGNAFSGNLVKMPIQSNTFYGENSSGEWTLKIVNSGLNTIGNVTFTGLRLQFTGSKSLL